jgi:hypothetical protein
MFMNTITQYSQPTSRFDCHNITEETILDSSDNSIDLEKTAADILATGRPIDCVLQQFAKIHIGDDEIGELLLLSIGCQLCSNADGLHVNLSGQSGKGKTDACKAMGFLLPEGYFISSSVSNKALLYMDLKPGSVVLIDDVDSFKEDMEQLIKSTTSFYQMGYKHCSTDLKKEGKSKIQEVMIPPRTTFWLTSVHSSFDAQVLNRFVKIDVDDGSDQDSVVLKQVLKGAVTGEYGYSVTNEVKICREMFHQLKNNPPCVVVIPYAEHLDWKKPENRRNAKMFLDLIRASAALNQYQRNRTHDGHVIANLDDFSRAARLWCKIDRAQNTLLNGEEQKVFDAIVKSGKIGISQKNLESKCRMNKGSISRAIHGKFDENSGEHKGGLKNKAVGLFYENLNKVWIYDGELEDQYSAVTLIGYSDSQAIADGCIQLHQVACGMQPTKTCVLST